jgi:hypothetical protein
MVTDHAGLLVFDPGVRYVLQTHDEHRDPLIVTNDAF